MKTVLSVIAILVLVAAAQPYPAAAYDKAIEKTFPIKMGGKLSIDLDSGGDIEIVGWDREEIAVRADVGGKDAEYVKVDLDPGASIFTIHSSCEKRRCSCDVSFTIKVPQRFDIMLDSRGGSVDIMGVEGSMSGGTMGGALELAHVRGKIDLETMGGSATVKDSEADGEISTMGGRVLIENVKGDLEGKTMGGDVTYKNVTGRSAESTGKTVGVSTMGGDIEIDNAGEKVKAHTYGGDIDVAKVEEADVSTMGGDIDIAEAPGGAKASTMGGDIDIHSAGDHVKAKTMGGDITVDAVDGWIDASTMGGDVTVTMVGDPAKGRRDVSLESMGGDITLTVPAGLSMKFDIDIEFTKDCHKKPTLTSDFNMSITESPQWERHWTQQRKHIIGTGTVGGGDHLVKIKTVNGNVVIKKG